MARYVDGFLIPIPKKKVAGYKKIAELAGKVWMEHGAVAYLEGVADDLATKGVTPFTKAARTKAGETVLFSWILYKSKKHRDQVNAKVMKDPRILKMIEKPMGFDMKRMSVGGFTAIVDR